MARPRGRWTVAVVLVLGLVSVACQQTSSSTTLGPQTSSSLATSNCGGSSVGALPGLGGSGPIGPESVTLVGACSDMMRVWIASPNGGSLSVSPTSQAIPSGYSGVGTAYDIAAPTATPLWPLEITFEIRNDHMSSIGVTAASLQVVTDGAVLTDCTQINDGANPMAPTPSCVSSRWAGPDYGAITVLTVVSSIWSVAK